MHVYIYLWFYKERELHNMYSFCVTFFFFARYHVERVIHILECGYRFFSLLITTIKCFIVWTCHNLSILLLLNMIAVRSYGLSYIWHVVKICVHFCWVYNWRGIAGSLGVHIFSFRRCGQMVSQNVLIPLRVLHPRAISWIRRMRKQLLLCLFVFW